MRTELRAALRPHSIGVLQLPCPGSSACARKLAASDLDVLLMRALSFPRDKVCGDGLIPDARGGAALPALCGRA